MVWVVVAAAAVVLAAGCAWLVLLWQASSRALSPSRSASPAEAGAGWRALEIPTYTGVTLAGQFRPGATGAAVVLTHGYGGHQSELRPIADALLNEGIGALTYDLRGCGGSGGTVTFGAHEQLDLRSVVDVLVTLEGVDPELIGALGYSVGGATTIMAAAGDERIRAVAAIAAWSDVYRWLRPSLREAFLHPRAPFTTLSLRLVELRTGIRLRRLRPIEDVSTLAPRPLLLLHGASDDVVWPEDSELLFAAAGEPKRLLLVPGEGHTDPIAPGGSGSGAEMREFFARSLLGKT